MRSLLVLVLFAISASAVDLVVPDWLTPARSDTKYYPDKDAAVGDTITFTWPDNYIFDVHKYPSGNCIKDGMELVGYQSGASYTFTVEDAGKEVFFANSVGRRCEDGQNIIVRVSDAPLQINSVQEASIAVANRASFAAMAMAVGIAVNLIL